MKGEGDRGEQANTEWRRKGIEVSKVLCARIASYMFSLKYHTTKASVCTIAGRIFGRLIVKVLVAKVQSTISWKTSSIPPEQRHGG